MNRFQVCDCIQKVDQALQEINPQARLETRFFSVFNEEKGAVDLYDRLALSVVNEKGNRTKELPRLTPNFCPFCGVKFPTHDETPKTSS